MASTNERILVIEDNPEVRENLTEILDLYGYRTLAADDGLEGVKMAIEVVPDLILCDVMMPQLDGYGVLNLLSENERTMAIPFVFITARTEKEDIRRGMNLGADDYITKPFYKDELLQVIRTRLKKAAGRGPVAPRLNDPERGLSRLSESLREEGRRQVYEKGQAIVREGEYAHFLFKVTEGHVHLIRTHEYGRDYIIAELRPGEMFGVPNVLERAPYHYTARAATATVTCDCLPTSSLFSLLNTDRSVTEALMHSLAKRIMTYGERLVNQAYDSVRRRTALVLCDLHEQHAGAGIELTREELAQMVGSTKESVTRALSEFKRDGLVTTEGRKVIIQQFDTLRGLLV